MNYASSENNYAPNTINLRNAKKQTRFTSAKSKKKCSVQTIAY